MTTLRSTSAPAIPIAPSADSAVWCRGLTKTYGSGDSAVRALRGVDLEVKKGELLMLVGPSGCGKTTLISVIAGVLNHDDGDCVVFDKDLGRISQAQRTKFRGHTIGFVFQAFNLIPTLTIAENVSVPLLINGESRRDALEKASAMLARVGLGERVTDYPNRLSGGQQQRVAIARSLVHRPRLIVCDEPTSALDKDTGHSVMELLHEIALGPEQSLIVVTHDQRIFQFADRIARMNDGVIERIVTDPEQLDYAH